MLKKITGLNQGTIMSIRGFYLRRKIRIARNDYQRAIECYNKAIELNPKDALAYYSRGKVKYKLKDYSGAIEEFNRAIELNPDFADAHYRCGRAKNKLKNYNGLLKNLIMPLN